MINKFTAGVSRRRSLVIWTVFCVIAGATFLAYTLNSLANGHGEFVMPLDDVYIHFQYARQMAAGQPYVYNPSFSATSGATSFLYPYVLVIGYLMGFQELKLGLWAMGVGAVALVGAMWLVYKLVRLMSTEEWLAVLVAAAFGVSGPVAWHFMSGMETGLVVLFTLGTLYGVMKVVMAKDEVDHRSINPFIVWATALALIRPEGGVLAVMAVAVVWWERRNLTPQPPLRIQFTRRQFCGFSLKSSPPNPLSISWQRGNSEEKDSRFKKCRLLNRIQREGVKATRRRWARIALIVPVLAVGIQPLVNLVMTGSAVASGNAAKSILGTVPFYWDDVIRRIIINFVQMWMEFGTGISPREGLYIMPLLLVLALVGIGRLLFDRKLRAVGVMLVLWLVGASGMLATLDTVFWHFKRYQMPLMALLFPLAGWGIGVVVGYQRQAARENTDKPPGRQLRQDSGLFQKFGYLVIGIMLVVGAVTGVRFLRYYGLNVGYVYAQPLQMARWLQGNTPDNAVIAVHDVGMMRYMGGRTTLDIVGLTTKGAADYWRNGPGAVAEFLMQEKPDYISSYGYGHGYGLGMIADTDIYGEPSAGFPVELDNNANVALAANFQGIYKPDWNTISHGCCVFQQSLVGYIDLNAIKYVDGAALGSGVDVANINSEQRASYSWSNIENGNSGFATEVHEFNYSACFDKTVVFDPAIKANCHIVDSGRNISGEESFRVNFVLDSAEYRNVVLITRIHPAYQGNFDVYINGQFLATRIIPEMPGQWLDVPTLIPKDRFSNPITIRIVPHVVNGYYMPVRHSIYVYNEENTTPTSVVSTFQNGAIQLGSAKLDYQPDSAKLGVNFEWYTDGSAKGDYKVFVHLYEDTSQPPVAQMDMRPGNGTLPPGNWLPGVLRDTITVDLNGVVSGKYRVAVGMYDPVTFERLQPTGGDEQGRLFIGEVEIKG